MSIVIATMEEREECFTENLFVRKVLLDERAELSATIEEQIKKIPQKGAFLRIEDFCDEDFLRRHRNSNRNIFQIDFDVSPSMRFPRTAGLNWFHENVSAWPVWKEGVSDEAIEGWNTLLSIAPDVRRVHDRIVACEAALADKAWIYSSITLDTRELHGWYVTVNTGRRQATGWVVGGRGATLHVLDDPISNIKPGGASDSASVVAGVVRAGTHHLKDLTPVKFSRKSTNVTLLLPPEVAVIRRQWVENVLAQGAHLIKEASSIHEKWGEWYERAGAVRERKNNLASFAESLPPKFGTAEDKYGYLRNFKGAREILKIAARELGEDRLRELVIEQYAIDNGGLLTEDDDRLLGEEPEFGAHNAAGTLANVIRSKVPNLDPEF